MKIKTLGIVMAHHGTEEICERHLPLWMQNCDRLTFFSPMDSIMALPGVEHLIPFGNRSHHGEMANMRFRYVIQTAAKMMKDEGYQRVVIHEYDSLCVGPLPDTGKRSIAGTVFYDNTHGSGFLGSCFIHPPLIIWEDLIHRLSDLLEMENMNGESGYWDRLLGLMTEKHFISKINFLEDGLSYSQNTIQQQHLIEIRTAKIHGARIFHGVKTEAAFETCIAAPSRRGGRSWRQSCRLPHGRTVAPVGLVPLRNASRDRTAPTVSGVRNPVDQTGTVA